MASPPVPVVPPPPRLQFRAFYTLNKQKHTIHLAFYVSSGAFEITLEPPPALGAPPGSGRRAQSRRRFLRNNPMLVVHWIVPRAQTAEQFCHHFTHNNSVSCRTTTRDELSTTTQCRSVSVVPASRQQKKASPTGPTDSTTYLLPALLDETGRRLGVWDLYHGACLNLLGRPITLSWCSAATKQWNRYWAEDILLPRRKKLREILREGCSGGARERLEPWLERGGGRRFVGCRPV